MRVLVTGGAGFVGSHLAEAFQRAGHEIVVLDNFSTGARENVPAGVQIIEQDLRDRDSTCRCLQQLRPDVVCHQAAQMSVSRSVREPAYDAEVNVLGLLNVLEGCVGAGVPRVLYASSGGVLYGDVAEPATEDCPLRPVSPYGISKLVGEHYLQFFAREHGLTVVSLRYSNVYGPRQNPHGEAGVVAIFCQRMLRGEPTMINGDGRYVRDYVSVSDVAMANLKALDQPLAEPFSAFNIGTGRGIDVNEIAARLHELCQAALQQRGRPCHVPKSSFGPPRLGDLRTNVISSRKAAEVLGWVPEVEFEDGLRQTVDWFADRIV